MKIKTLITVNPSCVYCKTCWPLHMDTLYYNYPSQTTISLWFSEQVYKWLITDYFYFKTLIIIENNLKYIKESLLEFIHIFVRYVFLQFRRFLQLRMVFFFFFFMFLKHFLFWWIWSIFVKSIVIHKNLENLE